MAVEGHWKFQVGGGMGKALKSQIFVKGKQYEATLYVQKLEFPEELEVGLEEERGKGRVQTKTLP